MAPAAGNQRGVKQPAPSVSTLLIRQPSAQHGDAWKPQLAIAYGTFLTLVILETLARAGLRTTELRSAWEGYFHHAAALNKQVVVLAFVLALLAIALPKRDSAIHKYGVLPVIESSSHLLAVAFGALLAALVIKGIEWSLTGPEVVASAYALAILAIAIAELAFARVLAVEGFASINANVRLKRSISIGAGIVLVIMAWRAQGP